MKTALCHGYILLLFIFTIFFSLLRLFMLLVGIWPQKIHNSIRYLKHRITQLRGKHLIHELGFFLRFYYLFLERGDRKEKRGGETSIGCLSPGGPKTRHIPWLGIEPATFHFEKWCPTNWAMLAKVGGVFFLILCF